MNGHPRIIAGCPGRILLSGPCRALTARLEAEARGRHAGALAAAPLWRRIWLSAVIAREVRSQLRRACPPHALYAAGGPRRPAAMARQAA
jgi:hypothetical protein